METLLRPAVIETSMSALDTFSRCAKKYEFQEVRGWVPRSASKPMVMGTAFHAALAAGNRAVRECDVMNPRRNENTRASAFKSAAVTAIATLQVDRDGKALGLTDDDRVLLTDMVEYWFAQVGERELLNIEKVLLVEEPLYIQIGQYLIRCTIDAAVLYAEDETPTILDYKTGDPKAAKAWIDLDLQTSIYYIAAYGRWGNVVQFRHLFQAREVPPGFGHNPLTTASGQKRAPKVLEAMQDPTRYTGVVETELTPTTIAAHTRELIDLVTAIDEARTTGRYIRNRIKIGPMSCDKCPYFEPCKAERDGQPPMDESFAQLSYIVKGSEEWEQLQAGKLALAATAD